MLSSLRRLVSSNGAAVAGDRRSQQSILSSPRRRRTASEGFQDTFSAFVDDWAVIEADLISPDQAALHHGVSRSNLPQALERLGQAIVQESLTTDEVVDGLGPCMEYLLKKDILGIIVRSALADRPAGVLIEAVKFFQTLVAHLGDRLLSQQAVNKPLVKLIRHCVGDEDVDSAWGQDAGFDVAEDREPQRRGSSEQARLDEALVGLMAFVASKLHGSQELLHIFFHNRLKDSTRRKGRDAIPIARGLQAHEADPQDVPASPRSASSMSTVKAAQSDGPAAKPLQDDVHSPASSYDFPLFTYLLRFVHLEGDTGQLARAGLSVLVQIALEAPSSLDSRSPELSNQGTRFPGELGSSATSDLAEYIAQSDFADVLGASLGAVWGLLPSKLAFVDQEAAPEKHGNAEGGMKLGAGRRGSEPAEAEIERLRRLNIDQSSDPRTIDRLKLFIDILDFVQYDVVGRAAQCSGSSLDRRVMASHELVTRLSASIRQSLLENVLSLSMIESGDRDGSAVAIMSYLEVLLSALDDRYALSDDVMGWLVRQDEHYPSNASSNAPANVMSRRKSAALLKLEKSKAEEAIYDPLLHYTIKDLILDHIAPTISDASVTAALGLARTLFTDHGRFAPYGLVEIIADDESTAFPVYVPPIRAAGDEAAKTESLSSPELDRLLDQADRRNGNEARMTLTQHFRELDLYLSLSAALGASARANALPPLSGTGSCSSIGYARYLQDAEDALLRNSMYLYGLQYGLTHGPSGQTSTNGSPVPTLDLPYPAFRHRLDPREPLLRSILSRLRRFFEQPPDLNVALTGTITAIALCPYRSMDSWLAFERLSTSDFGVKQGDEGYDWKKAPQLRKSPAEAHGSKLPQVPIVLELLHRLVEHVQNYRAAISDFDTFLDERRKGLLFVENITEALADTGHDGDDDEGFFARSSAGPSAPKSEKARMRLWKSVGWSTLGQTEIGNVHVLDAREVKLPPRQTDVASQRSLESSPSTFTRLFGRSPAAKSKAMRKSEPSTPPTKGTEAAAAGDKETQALPFAEHYRQTAAITLQASFVPMPQGPWTTSRASTSGDLRVGKREWGPQSSTAPSASSPSLGDGSDSGISLGKIEKRTRFQLPEKDAEQTSSKGTPVKEPSAPPIGLFPSPSQEDPDPFPLAQLAYPGLDEDEDEEARRTRGRVTLSDLLDNVVVLEEFIKELAAVLQMRRTLGIDAVRMFE
ncbi:hypothetical protein BCV69DRAFT_310342 [Microstroma glucosiphilum]|uniref:FHF complex subunit HOOK-interacting protein C-terminal domain-containing protein n=1 Tax=Pseudomicrostroma glucosiphilum TaxID=1684307 RepID=A0A316UCF5_9BASI|nr:hypothetical protein BCV69DRAFT_310342 [Pseudomicrostroma glucosiphilum]PWN22832.1 hypothetical protein BCV69DRAFT_310342 [Pseudomicrostroma glucosiphilum]